MTMRPLHFWLALAAILTFIGVNGYMKTIAKPTATEKVAAEKSNLYMGINRVDAKKVHQLFPDAKGKPLLLMFHSQYCHDCKRMKPVIESIVPKHSKLVFKSFDIFNDQKKFAAVFSAYKPVSVPILVFVDAGGKTTDILYNYQKTATIENELAHIGG